MPSWEDTTGVTDAEDPTANESFERNRPCVVVLSGLHIGQTFTLDPDGSQIIGRSRSADIRLVDDGVSRKHISIASDPDGNLWLEDLCSRNGTFCNGTRTHRRQLHDGDKIQLGRNTMLRFTYLDEHDEGFQRLMYDSALRDGLTRTFNRRYFIERLQSEFRFAKRHRTPVALLLMDLDHFKRVNDMHGHVAGDFVLTEFVDAVQKAVRGEDVFARYGGEEFVIITRAIATEDALQLAERLRVIVEQLQLQFKGRPIPLTISIGVACLPDIQVEEPVELIEAADRALYSAKARGRNQVVLYTPNIAAVDSDLGDMSERPTLSQPGHE